MTAEEIRARVAEKALDDDTLELIAEVATEIDANSAALGAERAENERLRSEVERIEKEWRRKYTERFFEGGTKPEPEPEPDPEPSPEDITIDDLFVTT